MEPLAPEDLVEDWSDLSTSSLGPGARLGRYELLIPIAYGGMARVWAARLHGQRGFSKLVAIKTILPHLAHNPEFEHMFLDEARIASGVHHPNVTEIYELGEEGHVLYLAMEWVNGESLVHALRGLTGKQVKALEARVAAKIVADACAGLHAAHELTDDDGRLLDVVHRDVSPHNLLVSLEGTVKVTDFGVAKAYGQSHQETVAGQVKGKVAYMAPEQIGGLAFDRRSDIFGMGCVLYEATTGTTPFRGGNDPQVMQAILSGTYEPPSKVVPGYPPELEGIVARALAPEPRDRFATAETMRVALEEWLAKSGSVVTPTQVGGAVRQRLGAHLEKRREHVRAAMQSVTPDELPTSPRPAAGGTPPSPQSHSGVVVTGASITASPASAAFRTRLPSHPVAGQAITPWPPPPAGVPVPALPAPRPPPPPLPIMRSAQPSPATKYAIAAIGGIVFAAFVGAVFVGVWMLLSPGGDASHGPAATPTAALVVAPKAAPEPGPLATGTALPPPSGEASPAAATAAPPPSPAPRTVDVSQLPTAKPQWTPPPSPPRGGGAPPPATTAKPPALPANPY